MNEFHHGCRSEEKRPEEALVEERDSQRILEYAAQFRIDGAPRAACIYGKGHINDTHRIETETGARYILQRLNPHVFHEPYRLLENFEHVTGYLRQRIAEEGGDVERETLHLIPALDGQLGLAAEGTYWRMYRYIDDCYTIQQGDTPESLAACGFGFGRFLYRLHDFPSEKLYEVIPYFHHTPRRVRRLEEVLREDPVGRLSSAENEVAQARRMMPDAGYLVEAHREGRLPLRVTHNDTKINNLLFDSKTRKALCVIDLDTIMPGLVAYDFGDAIRAGASSGAEDERDLSKVHFLKDYYRAFAESYLAETRSVLSPEEVDSLPWGAYLMTYECGVRFLTDYLEGDVYFKCETPDHNLVRARTQFRMAEEIKAAMPELLAMGRAVKA